jgi:serine/threonine-protein kinase
MSAIGTVLRDRYEIITELGKGGMSTVYLARDKNLDCYWAVKHVKNKTTVDIKAFKKEVELLASLNHSDIPRIVDRVEIDDDYFVVMDFIDGTALGKKVLAQGTQPEKIVVEWAKLLCDVLHYLHTVRDNPIVYCDLKPDNIMLTQAGRLKLIDFGIARECRRGLQQQGANVGTRGYAAPEQYKGTSNILDERTDIYSLGATLYYLVTGLVPGKPPKAMHPIRQLNPLLSEGLEYIIDKATRNDPADRYQNCLEMREDLENIEQLNSSYRNKIARKIVSFTGSLILSLVFFVFVLIGNSGIKAQRADNFQTAFQIAVASDRRGDYAAAATHYAEAIQYKPGDLDTYLLLFNALLPRQSADDHLPQMRFAIDEMRKRYIDNPHSEMYNNSLLMYQVAKRCTELNDPVYAATAVKYFELIKSSEEYTDGRLNATDIDCYEIIASNCATNLATQDFKQLNQALIELESNTDAMRRSANEMLENYYVLMVIYSAYSPYLDDAYERIHQIGINAKAVIDNNITSEELTFNNVVRMYELVASSLYTNAIIEADTAVQRDLYEACIEWFGYLDDLNYDLPEVLALRKGNAYRGVFYTFDPISERGAIDSSFLAYVDEAIEIYQEIIRGNSNSFLAHLYLTQAYLDKELCKPLPERDFTAAKNSYPNVLALKEADTNLSVVALSQFGALRRQMQNAGLEGR